MSIDNRLAELGITLPQAAAPVAAYVPAVEQGGLLHISGQVSFAEDGNLILGRLGEDMNLERGQESLAEKRVSARERVPACSLHRCDAGREPGENFGFAVGHAGYARPRSMN